MIIMIRESNAENAQTHTEMTITERYLYSELKNVAFRNGIQLQVTGSGKAEQEVGQL